MKFLLLGIDAAEEMVIHAMPISLLKRGRTYPVHVDLWSRGSAEIFTSGTGVKTGACYTKPDCNGRSPPLTSRM